MHICYAVFLIHKSPDLWFDVLGFSPAQNDSSTPLSRPFGAVHRVGADAGSGTVPGSVAAQAAHSVRF